MNKTTEKLQKEAFKTLLLDDPCNKYNDCEECPYDNLYDGHFACYENRYADHLIASGAVIPPVDIGDEVWYIEGGYYNAAVLKPRKITVTEINKKKCGKTIDWAFIANGTRYKFTSIGKVVFLSEEAALAEINRRKEKGGKK